MYILNIFVYEHTYNLALIYKQTPHWLKKNKKLFMPASFTNFLCENYIIKVILSLYLLKQSI